VAAASSHEQSLGDTPLGVLDAEIPRPRCERWQACLIPLVGTAGQRDRAVVATADIVESDCHERTDQQKTDGKGDPHGQTKGASSAPVALSLLFWFESETIVANKRNSCAAVMVWISATQVRNCGLFDID
jgi:hypothetical protein